MMGISNWLSDFTFSKKSIAPLVVFRILFGMMMLISTMRFIVKGWLQELYIEPTYFFTYYGFDWVRPFDIYGMYLLYGALILSAIFITIGLFYRVAISLFFFAFTYIELIDKTNYLNHYYFISLIAFILLFLPANRSCSVDQHLGFVKRKEFVPAWNINLIKFQIGLVYFFAGLSKLNYHWLFEAQPLSNWLKHQTDLPFIGELMQYDFTAYVFSWGGAIFDLMIPFILLNKRFRLVGYNFVILFHTLTSIMFPIGVFPFVMIVSTLMFFSSAFHEKLLFHLQKLFSWNKNKETKKPEVYRQKTNKIHVFFIGAYIMLQVLIPLRFLIYSGDLFWTEQGYRFSWRVMLIEKAGYAQFYVHDAASGNKKLINTSEYLKPQQEKMMVTQPDMILQFAHHIRDQYSDTIIVEKNGLNVHLESPKITAEIYVSLFNKGSKLFIDSTVNLSKINRGFAQKKWILKNEN